MITNEMLKAANDGLVKSWGNLWVYTKRLERELKELGRDLPSKKLTLAERADAKVEAMKNLKTVLAAASQEAPEKDYWLEDAADKLRKLDLPQHATHVENAARRMRRLRHTLQLISLGSQNSGTSKEDLGREARMALGEAPE